MHLDAVETRLQRILRRTRIGFYQGRKLGNVERARRDEVLHPLSGEGLPGRPYRGRGHRQLAAGLEIGMRDAAHMPQLKGDLAAGAMHSLGYPSPAGNLRLAMNARRAWIAMRLQADRRGLGEDQARTGPLPVILGH